jgi:hypothetical protein
MNIKIKKKEPAKEPKSQLKVCPFCKTQNGSVVNYPLFYIKCLRCGALGPLLRESEKGGMRLLKNTAEAIELWNRR